MAHLVPCGVCLTILIVYVSPTTITLLLLFLILLLHTAIGSRHRFNRIHTLGYGCMFYV